MRRDPRQVSRKRRTKHRRKIMKKHKTTIPHATRTGSALAAVVLTIALGPVITALAGPDLSVTTSVKSTADQTALQTDAQLNGTAGSVDGSLGVDLGAGGASATVG